MTQLDKTKYEAITVLKNLCARCKEDRVHICPVQQVTKQIQALKGIPVIVNAKLYHVVFN